MTTTTATCPGASTIAPALAPALASSLMVLVVMASLLVATRAHANEPPAPLDCVIEPSMMVSIGSEAEGVLASVDVSRGALVEEGQLLATLDDNLERAAASLYQARASTDVSVRWNKVKLGFGKRAADRVRRLQRKAVVSDQELDQATTDENLMALKHEEARVNRRLARLEYQRAQAALDQRRIVSPLRGLVVERLMHPGERITDQPILSLAAIDVLHVEVIAPVSMHGRIKAGQRARVVPEEPVGGEYGATVSVVDRVMDARSGTFGVRLTLPNADHALPAGLRCSITFDVSPTMAEAESPTAAPSVPSPAPVPAEAVSATDAAARPMAHDLQNEPLAAFAAQPVSENEPSGAVTAPGLADSLLASALPAARAATREPAPERSTDTAPPSPPGVCMAFGEFGSPTQADAMARLLSQNGHDASVRETQSPATGYLTLVDGGSAPAAALRRLRDKGIQDLQLLRTGPHAGMVSLGYFRQRDAALRHHQQLAKQGIEARVEPRGTGARAFWVDLQVDDEEARGRIERRLHRLEARLQIQARACGESMNARL